MRNGGMGETGGMREMGEAEREEKGEIAEIGGWKGEGGREREQGRLRKRGGGMGEWERTEGKRRLNNFAGDEKGAKGPTKGPKRGKKTRFGNFCRRTADVNADE